MHRENRVTFLAVVGAILYILTNCQVVDQSNQREFADNEVKFHSVTGNAIKAYAKNDKQTKKPWKVRLVALGMIPSFDQDVSEEAFESKLKVIYVDKPELKNLSNVLKANKGETQAAPPIQPPEFSAFLGLDAFNLEKLATTATNSSKQKKLPFSFSGKDGEEGELIVYLFFQNIPPAFSRAGIVPDSTKGHRILDSSIRVSLFLKESGSKLESFRCQKRILTEYPSDWLLTDWLLSKGSTVDSLVIGKGLPIRKNEIKIGQETYSVEAVLSECFQGLAKEI
ncbi:hypothetical protein EHQ53_01585 [Leptospira langatensis]|uniref:Uncharacterized protein n=1 Tax=Leptospira langatensis TaxID=2484983 RepID=A0A5F1ZWW4_9LEPT|nr:hypothetical protein [Leptospira langatensis]TGJ98440.1 hypothetical protein EHO57_17725 [Leptospira langatensis]TGL43355.1 hypothetical protein EHQ53_01585 [Leptospira langatensis]